ncbi:hypothetical protein N7461_004938 [Penicillium sp. DV-2018c]|nr:hypothetical protein N7461_004938 [Penicillium sp. DV-2018c]
MANPFNRRSIPDYFVASPLVALLYPLHQVLLHLRGPPRLPPPDSQPIRVVCISDTHTHEWPDVPDGDLLIHAGDLSNDGSIREIQASVDWLRSLPHKHKVAIGGNHDSYFDVRSRLDEDREDPSSTGSPFAAVSSSSASIHSLHELNGPSRIDWGDIHYLQHSAVTLSFSDTSSPSPTTPLSSPRSRSLTIYGAPKSQPSFPSAPSTPSHTPRNMTPGCPNLLAESWRVRPALHVFGHVHESAGQEPVFWDEAQRAWERLCASRRSRARYSRLSSLAGFLRDLFDLTAWIDAARVVGYGVLGIVWAHVWGGENLGGSWMVNAACMYRDSGRLGNKPRVIYL